MPLYGGVAGIIHTAKPLRTGQVTRYNSELDDGYYQDGVPRRFVALGSGQYDNYTDIVLNGKTDHHHNDCVLDLDTGLMWFRDPSLSVGPGSDGAMPWTGSVDDIFQYMAAVNALSVSGHSDWKVPTRAQLIGLCNLEAPTAVPDVTYFPWWPDGYLWSSTTAPTDGANAFVVSFWDGGSWGSA